MVIKIHAAILADIALDAMQDRNLIDDVRNSTQVTKMPWMAAIFEIRAMIGSGEHGNALVISRLDVFLDGAVGVLAGQRVGMQIYEKAHDFGLLISFFFLLFDHGAPVRVLMAGKAHLNLI